MKFPNSDALTSLVEDELERGVRLIKAVEKIADDPQKVELNMQFFPLKVDKDDEGNGKVFIPLGTKDQPAGISTTKYKYALVFDEDFILIFSIDVIKSYIKSNFKSLVWSMDKWYEVMGFEIGLRGLISHEAEVRKGAG